MRTLIYVVMDSPVHEAYIIYNCSPRPLTPFETPSCASSPAQEKISFQITRQKFKFIFEECQDSLCRIRQEVEYPAEPLSFRVDTEEVYEDSCEFYLSLYDSLERIGIPGEALHCLAGSIIENASAVIRLDRILNPSLKDLLLKVRIIEVHFFTTSDASPEFENTMRESLEVLEEANYGMVPTSEKGKDSMLKIITVAGERNTGMKNGYEGGEWKRLSCENINEETCAICFEDIPVGGAATQLPCAHVFHGYCIEHWLEVSHYCPMCRFEFPAD